MSYQFALQRVDLLHHSRVEFDGFGDVCQHLFVRVGRLLVQQDPHSSPGLHAAPHHRHEFWPYEVLDLVALGGAGHAAAQGRRRAGGSSGGLDVHRPIGVYVFGVVQLLVSFDGAAHIAVT